MDLLWRISHGDGIFGPIGMELRSRRTDSRGFLAGKAVLRVSLNHSDLFLNESIRPGEVWGGGVMGYVMAHEKLCEVI